MQWTGNGPVSYYYPAMLKAAGVSDKHKLLIYNGAQNVVSFGGAVFGAIYTDKFGRRKQLMTSVTIIICIFVIITGLNATNLRPDPEAPGKFVAKSSQQANAIIAFVFIFGFVFGAGYTPLQALYPVECAKYEVRAKSMGVYNFFVNIAGFYNTFVTEIAFTRASWKYYFLFISFDIVQLVIIYFFFVETKGRTLEELTDIFLAKHPVKTSLQKEKITADGEPGVSVEHIELSSKL
jgi:MFS family permease